MRKPRDYDAELEALDQKARALRQRKIMQLGELVIACNADTLPIELLAGALLGAVGSNDEAERARWSRAGEAMFRSKVDRGAARGVGKVRARSTPTGSAAPPTDGAEGTR